MASSVIGQLRVALSLGTAEFESGAAKAASVAKTRAKEIEGAFAGAKEAVSGLFAAFTVGLLADQVKKSLEYAGSLAEVSRTLGVTTKDLQTFRFAATQTGVAQDQLEVGLRRLTVSMGKAELGSKAQAKAFAAIGISVDQLKGKDTGDVFRLMADGLSKVTDRSQRAAIEMTLMGRSGSTLDNLLAPGAKRLNELADAAQTLGVVLSNDQIQHAEETAHKLEALQTVLKAQIAGEVANNANSILTLANALIALVGAIGPAIQGWRKIVAEFKAGAPFLALGPLGIPGAEVAMERADNDLTVHDFLAKHNRPLGVDTLTDKAAKPVGTDLPQFLGGGGRAKRAPKAPTDKSADEEFQVAQQQRQIDLQILDAKKALSHDYVEQTTLSIQSLDVQKAITNADLDHKLEQAAQNLAEHRITAEAYKQIVADVAKTRAKETTLDSLKRQAVLAAEAEQRFHDVAALDQQALDFRKSHLQDELALATTASERRDLELKILDIDYQIQKAKLEEVLADTQASDQAKEMARRGLVALNGEQGLKRQDILQQTQGPLGQYLNSLPTTAAKWTEALQSVAVDGFGQITNAADTLAGKIIKVGGVFGDVTRTIIADLLKIELQKLILAPLANALGGILGGSSPSGGISINSGTGNFFSANPIGGSIPHLAGGGSMMIGGNPGTDQNTLALNGIPMARVGRGETLTVDPNGGRGGGNVYQTIAPNFAGNAATKDDLLQMAILTKQAAISAINERNRRR